MTLMGNVITFLTRLGGMMDAVVVVVCLYIEGVEDETIKRLYIVDNNNVRKGWCGVGRFRWLVVGREVVARTLHGNEGYTGLI